MASFNPFVPNAPSLYPQNKWVKVTGMKFTVENSPQHISSQNSNSIPPENFVICHFLTRDLRYDATVFVTVSFLVNFCRTITSNNFEKIVHVAPVSKSDSSQIHMVAVTDTGEL